MFDRRLKIFLACIFAVSLVLMARTLQIQVIQYATWEKRADKLQTKPTYIDTVRGRILDVKGRVLAEDVPCIDAMVDYHAIPQDPDEKWLHDTAAGRLAARMGEDYTKAPKAKREQLLKPEILAVQADLQAMWSALARCPGMDEQKIADARQDVVRRVENRVRWIWFRNYQAAMDTHDKQKPEAWYSRWLLDEDKAPELDDFKKTIGDELISYPIVHAIDPDTITALGKNLGRFPGLSLQPSTHRYYQYKEIGCHWIGNLAPVTREERQEDPNFTNEKRRYDYSDLIGRAGIEALAEPVLRGSRGLVEREVGTNRIVNTVDAVPGKDVTTTIDIELQQEIQDIFLHIKVPHEDNPNEVHTYHGAAVVIDIATGQVRAMASNPSFDPNELQEKYTALASDHLNQPLLNRATMDVLEPGSTVKPMVGLWGMKTGVLGINEQIQCNGYMMYQGKKQPTGRCWVTRILLNRPDLKLEPIDHPIPYPLGHDLSFADALERSCNPFHETVANRLGMDRLSEGFAAFGLGRPTGIGIAERIGRLPNSYSGPHELNALWSAGIGQGQIAATPLQMANAIATIARGGIWMRPTLIASAVDPSQLHYAVPSDRPMRDDLHIPPEAIAMAHEGMWNVVHGHSGTGTFLDFPEVGVCGKTGSAQAAMFTVPELDEKGNPIPRLDDKGQPIPLKNRPGQFLPKMIPVQPDSPEHPNPDVPWYRGTGSHHDELTHGWYVGFAPARENPKIAFAVLTEYGGTGGIAGAAVAHELLAACVAHGYLVRGSQ